MTSRRRDNKLVARLYRKCRKRLVWIAGHHAHERILGHHSGLVPFGVRVPRRMRRWLSPWARLRDLVAIMRVTRQRSWALRVSMAAQVATDAGAPQEETP